ncbi:MAG TPA: NAD-dependent protein deacylase [Tissierellia bacterium]|nr:NAD-dependent protein deacylase [Tissierellia bacterium]
MIRQLKRLIDQAETVVFFGGAGVSTESGVPDFRSSQGLYRQYQGAEKFLSPRFLKKDPVTFYTFYRKHFLSDKELTPNQAHIGLAELEARGKLAAIITQNVDRLHQKAGSKTVYELHGRADTFTCRSCGKVYTKDQIRQMDHVPYCSCGEILRSDVVLFDEGLEPKTHEQAIRAIEQADLLIIGGSSLRVYPAAGLLRYQKPGGKKVLINLEPGNTPVELEINRPIGEVFGELMQLYEMEERE